MERDKRGVYHQFQRGRCHFGANCKYSHISGPGGGAVLTAPPCHAFNTPQGCKFGPRCKYSHNGAAPNRTQREPENDDLQTWKKDLRQSQPLQGFGLGRFFDRAMQLVISESDYASRQEVIAGLASEQGLRKIQQLAQQDFEQMSDKVLQHNLTTQIVPFFRTISEPNVTASAMLERHVGSIYTLLYGVTGARAVQLFKAVLRALKASEGASNVVTFCSNLEATFAVLDKLMEYNSTAKVTPDFKAFATDLSALMVPQNEPAASASLIQAMKHLDRINNRLGIGKDICSMSTNGNPTHAGPKPTFLLRRDQPGQLANGRPRHDNDSASINDIQVLPTSAEIKSTHPEYLPLQDPSTWHKPQIAGLIDRHFRLLREDTVGQLRDCARDELEALHTMSTQPRSHNNHGLRKYTYRNVLIELPKFDPVKGLEFVISFDQPPELMAKTPEQRRKWWEQSKRLEGDATVCLLSSTDVVVFCNLCYPDDPSKRKTKTENGAISQDLHAKIQHARTQNRVQVIARLVEMSEENVTHILETFSTLDFPGGRSLVEFPGVLLPAFMPTLSALKTMSTSLELPFSDILAQPSSTGEGTLQILPPAYTRKAGFRFQLDSVCKDGTHMQFDPTNFKKSDVKDLQNASTLDESQALALLGSLSRSLALIEGPPGTGKSFTGVALAKILVRNRRAGRLGPIVCVTFTNHALDQSLEHLIDEGITQIVRLGSRSKSERLTELTLRKVSEKMDKTKAEKSEFGRVRGKMKSEAKEITKLINGIKSIDGLEKSASVNSIHNYLGERYPRFQTQIFGNDGVDEFGFKEVRYGNSQDRLENWLKSGSTRVSTCRSVPALQTANDLNVLSKNERWLLLRHWVAQIKDSLLQALLPRIATFAELQSDLDKIRNELDLRVLNQASVIGVTTSGLARNLNLLRRLPSKVLICEEAGEVLESHLLTALLPSVEHAILIGDHLQLRPHIACYELSQESARGKQYALDTSLFERLVLASGGGKAIPFSRLDIQRRMFPSIAELVRSTLYPTLRDAPSTPNHPTVAGIKKRLFWLDHQQPETHGDMNSTSHTNDFEVEMTTAMVSHLLKQGVYKAGSIAILTPYLGQLRKLRHRLQSSFEIVLSDRDVDDLQKEGLEDTETSRPPPAPGVQKASVAQAVRIATVDNFQGEEADVVIISLVRSNAQRKCGFLKTSNRINVLLSRARNGMYIIGNADTTQHVRMWTQVIEVLQMDGNFGQALELSCPRHPDGDMIVTRPDDFGRLAPDGGCVLPCTQRLLCGHVCDSKCHSQLLHDAVKCLAPCPRPMHGCEHSCPKPCGEKCPQKCRVTVHESVKLPCGHMKQSPLCYEYQNQDEIRCHEIVEREIPGCRHKVSVKCFVNVNEDKYACTSKCGETLPCGHVCQKSCRTCKKRVDCAIVEQNHGECLQPCGRAFSNCSHSCRKKCHEDSDCGLCEQPCAVKCSHSACAKKCSEPCVPCAEEKCSSKCPHSSCSLPCAAPCDWIPCSLRCEKMLRCGHRCPGLCGAPCPGVTFCQVCASEEVKNRTVDLIMLTSYKETDLDEEPCVFPACGHFYTVSTMDGTLSITDHYELDSNGLPTDLKIPDDNLDVDKTRMVCPDCRCSLRDIPRYGRVVRRALLIQSTLKFITWSNTKYVPLAQGFFQAHEKLQQSVADTTPAHVDLALNGTRDSQIHTIANALSRLRYGTVVDLRRDISRFQASVQTYEQPFQQVRELVRNARNRKQTEGHFTFDASTILQTRSYALASAVLLRCDLAILSDVLTVRSSERIPVDVTTVIDLSANRMDCDNLFKTAEQGKHHLQQAEALVFWAHFAALEISWRSSHVPTEEELECLRQLRDKANEYLELARKFCNTHAQASAVVPEIDTVGRMLRESTFYSPVTGKEMQEVVSAMAREFRGTGHWYYCRNGHPFTIGECGGLMQETKCPQCGEPIGGSHHQAAEGVTSAIDLEQEFGGISLNG